MAANTSSLQVEVVSVGIQETVRRLDSLGNAAGRNEAKVKLLTDSLGKLMTAQNSAVGAAAQHAALMSAIAQQMGMVASSATSTAKQVALLNSQLGTLNATSGQTAQAFQRKSHYGGIVNSTIRAMTTAALAYLSINFAKGIIEAADGWKMMQARLKLATGSMEEAKMVQADLFNMAQRLRVPLEDAAKLYTRMAIPMQRMGKDAKETANQVEYVSLALKLNGATAAESSSVMLQYSQAVNAGRLNGAEFNAVAEGAPGILRAIEEELKATGKWSETTGKTLKKMGSDGEITFDLMNRAAQRALPQMRKDFEQLPITVDGAIQRVKNAWFKAMGEMGEETGMGTKLAAAVLILEQSIPAIRDAMVSVFLFLNDNFGKIAMLVGSIIAIKFVFWLGGVSTAMIATAAAAATAATGIGVAQTAVLAFGRGMALLAGPVGIIIALLGIGAVQAYRAFAASNAQSETAATGATSINTTKRIEMIQREIDKLDERNGKAKIAPPVVVDQSAHVQNVINATARVNEVIFKMNRAKQEGKTGEASMLGLDLDFEKGELARLKVVQADQVRAVEENNKRLKDVAVDKWQTTFNLKHESKPVEFERRLKAAQDGAAEVGAVWKKAYEDQIRLEVFGKNMGGPAPDKRNHFDILTSSIKAATEALEIHLVTGAKATPAEKLRAEYDSGKNADYKALSPKERDKVDAGVKRMFNLEQEIELRDRNTKATEAAAKAEADMLLKMDAGTFVIADQTQRIREQIAALTISKTAAKDMAAVQMEADASRLEMLARNETDPGGNEKLYVSYMAQARALREMGSATRELGAAQDEKAALEELDKLLNPKKALDFGDALGEAFGKAGDAIGKMTKALGVYGKSQEDIDDQRAKFMSLTDEKKRTAGLQALDKLEMQSKLRAAGAMAGAAKDLMSEHTAGYKIMAATERAFRIAEMAMTIESTATKVWGSLTAASAKSVETTAVTTGASVDAAATGGAIASSFARASAYVMEGAAKMYAWLGPFAPVAIGAMLAVMASVGFSGGGGSATPIDFKDRQEKQHTGTVLGDDTAKSASIANAMSALEDNSNVGLVLTSNMLSSLRGIEASMQGLTAAIGRATGMTTGKNFGIAEGTSGGGFLSSIFGGKTTTTVMDTGLTLNGTADQFSSGQGAQQYVDVNKQKSGGWFSKAKSWNERSYMAADAEITTTIGRVFQSINDTVAEAATSLGANGANIKAAMDAYVINTEVSFKGLKGDELKQALEDMFSATADSMARTVFGGFEAFQRAGEGYYETIVRVATGSEQAMNALESFGIQMVDIRNLTNKSGDIAAELVRESIMAKEAGTTMAEVMRVLDGGLSDLVEGYKTLLSIQDTMRGAGLGNGISRDTIRGAGGIAELDSALSDFIDGFYSDAEKQVISFSKLRAEFKRLNVVMPETKDGFKTLVTSLMAGDVASQELAGRVLLLGGAFADAFAEAEEARSDAVDKAKDNLSDAYDKESEALENTIDKMKEFTKSLGDFKNSLIMGDLSTKSGFEKYATAQALYTSTSALAATGDVTAIGNFEKVASEFLKLSREVNASGVNYTADYDMVLAATTDLGKYTASQVDVATASLDLLKEQVKGLLDVNESVLTVTEAIVALHLAMAPSSLPGVDGSHAMGLSSVPFDGYVAELHKGEAVLTASQNNEYRANLGNTGFKTDTAMVDEIKALREELKQLREEQRNQTMHMIEAGYDSNEQNARMVVAGTKGAMEDASYLERTKTGLN